MPIVVKVVPFQQYCTWWSRDAAEV
jgi:hypothetical protein